MQSGQSENNRHYYILNKPIRMVSQFVSPHNVGLLADLGFDFPKGTHAVGRLDNNSEGLLILTTNKKVTSLLFSGNTKHKRVYLVQVNNQLGTQSLKQLGSGVSANQENDSCAASPLQEINTHQYRGFNT